MLTNYFKEMDYSKDFQFPKMKGFTIAHVNCRSVQPKLIEIKPTFNNIDFVAFTESWLSKTSDPALLTWTGKSAFRIDRNGLAGGIVCYLTDRVFKYASVNEELSYISDNIETLSIDIDIPKNRMMTITTVYKPSGGNVPISQGGHFLYLL